MRFLYGHTITHAAAKLYSVIIYSFNRQHSYHFSDSHPYADTSAIINTSHHHASLNV
jgi:hypothetical protein